MAIVRWDPFREFGGAWMPPVDIYSTGEHELVIKAEIPGMNKEDLDITVENFTLTIRGEKKAEQMYKQNASNAGTSPQQGGPNVQDGEVVDAEVVDA